MSSARWRRSDRPSRPSLNRLVRGDLDWIVMKCLEKDRARRYETANNLALDIEHHLKHEPVSAAAPEHGLPGAEVHPAAQGGAGDGDGAWCCCWRRAWW